MAQPTENDVVGGSGGSGTNGGGTGGGGGTNQQNQLQVRGIKAGSFNNAITITDADGNTLNLSVVVQEIHVEPPPVILPVEINPQVISMDYIGQIVLATIRYSGGYPKMSQVGSSAGAKAWYGITRGVAHRQISANQFEEDINVKMLAAGYWSMAITGGPDSQKFTDNLGNIHTGAFPFYISCGNGGNL